LESATAWREVFKDLKSRGLDSSLVRLGVMDRLTGLQVMFKAEDKIYGNSCGRDILLLATGIHIFKNRDEIETHRNRQGAS